MTACAVREHMNILLRNTCAFQLVRDHPMQIKKDFIPSLFSAIIGEHGQAFHGRRVFFYARNNSAR